MYSKGMTTRQISDTLIDYSSMFISSLISDLIRIIHKYLIGEKHLNFISKIHKNGVIAFIIFAVIIIGSVYGMNHIELTEYIVHYLNFHGKKIFSTNFGNMTRNIL